jgi:hypothetical protein
MRRRLLQAVDFGRLSFEHDWPVLAGRKRPVVASPKRPVEIRIGSLIPRSSIRTASRARIHMEDQLVPQLTEK